MPEVDLDIGMTIALVVAVVVIICCIGWLITFDDKKSDDTEG
jgi:hypothetical protein